MHFERFNVVKKQLLFQVVNQSGLVNYTNIKSGQPIAVTWGVFPGSEIVQVSRVNENNPQFADTSLGQDHGWFVSADNRRPSYLRRLETRSFWPLDGTVGKGRFPDDM